MIDNIKIIISNFSGSFENCLHLPLKSNTKYQKFNLFNEKLDNPYLLLDYNTTSNSLVITNSLRKWYLGEHSLIDLTQETFFKALQLLAKLLKINIETLLKSSFTNSEIGLNLRIDFPISFITNKIAKYSTFRRDTYGMTTVNFIGQDRKIKIYDKLNELEDTGKISQNLKLALEDKNYFFIRIEVVMKDKQSFKNLKLYDFENLGELYLNYNQLYIFWAKEVSKIIIFNKIIYNSSMSFEEYLISVTLNNVGYFDVINQCKLKIKDPLKRSRQIEKILNVIEKYPDKSTFNTAYFRKSVLSNLKRINKKNLNMDIQEIENILIPVVNYNKK